MKKKLVYALLFATVAVHSMEMYHEVDLVDDYRFSKELQTDEQEGLLAGTLIKIPFGYMAIEQLEIGDCVISRNEYGILETDFVVAVERKKINNVVRLMVNGVAIIVANGHKFFTPLVKRWIKAYKMTYGDKLLAFPATSVPIESIEILAGDFDVISISVANNHNFFVSERDLLVHNMFATPTSAMPLAGIGATLLTALPSSTTTTIAATASSALSVVGTVALPVAGVVAGVIVVDRVVIPAVDRALTDATTSLLKAAAPIAKEQIVGRIIDPIKEQIAQAPTIISDDVGNMKDIVASCSDATESNESEISTKVLRSIKRIVNKGSAKATATGSPAMQQSAVKTVVKKAIGGLVAKYATKETAKAVVNNVTVGVVGKIVRGNNASGSYITIPVTQQQVPVFITEPSVATPVVTVSAQPPKHMSAQQEPAVISSEAVTNVSTVSDAKITEPLASIQVKQEPVVKKEKTVTREQKKKKDKKKQREELYIPIQISFLSYEVMTDEYEDDDTGEVRVTHFLDCETVFIGGSKSGGDYYETAEATVGFWTPAMYEQQWREGLERIKTQDTSCLVLDITKDSANVWVLYRIDNNIYIQNLTPFGDCYQRQTGCNLVTPTNCYDFLISPRKTFSADGKYKIAEWVVPILTRTIENK
ncbi:polymorphic toxin-type HINT domain-containing protein [Candidatus Dependentiae bacterium]|nr:polymorphic toxin-type HINT domain-containing protein [Candidatus Dependentiae bacterium]